MRVHVEEVSGKLYLNRKPVGVIFDDDEHSVTVTQRMSRAALVVACVLAGARWQRQQLAKFGGLPLGVTPILPSHDAVEGEPSLGELFQLHHSRRLPLRRLTREEV